MCFVACLRALLLILHNIFFFAASLSKVLPSMNYTDEQFFSQNLQLSAVNKGCAVPISSSCPDAPLLRDFFIHRYKPQSTPCAAD